MNRIFNSDHGLSLTLGNIRLITAILSLILSLLAFQLDGLMNSDGILYMNMAKAYLGGGLEAAAKFYDWPFFSILIAYFHLLSGISLEISGEIINTILFVIFTDALILISTKLLPNLRHLAISALFILCFITLNDYRGYIIRDTGYWAMVMLALYAMIKFIERPTWLNASLWQLSIISAFLFRIEAIAILIVLPFASFLYYPAKTACLNLLKLNYILIAALLFVFAVFLHFHSIPESFGKIGSITDFLDLSDLQHRFTIKSDVIAKEVLSVFAEEDSSLVLASGLLAMLIAKLLFGLSFSYVGLYIYAKIHEKSRSIQNEKVFILIGCFAAINLFVLLIFLYKSYFMSTRYTVALLTAILLLMLPKLCHFIDKLIQNKNHKALIIIFFIIFAGLVDSMTSSVKKDYIKNVATWAAHHLPADTQIMTDDIFVAFYFDENQPKADVLLVQNIQNYSHMNYVITVQKMKDPTKKVLFDRSLKVVHESQNKRGDKAIILKNEKLN